MAMGKKGSAGNIANEKGAGNGAFFRVWRLTNLINQKEFPPFVFFRLRAEESRLDFRQFGNGPE